LVVGVFLGVKMGFQIPLEYIFETLYEHNMGFQSVEYSCITKIDPKLSWIYASNFKKEFVEVGFANRVQLGVFTLGVFFNANARIDP